MCPPLMHPSLSHAAQFRVGYNNGYTGRPPHMALINEQHYRDGWETGEADRRAGHPYSAEIWV